MANPSGQHPYQGYGQPQQGYGGFGGGPQTLYPGGPMPGSGVAAQPLPSRPGTSKALPIIIAVGLGIGVFGGLMIMRGTSTSGAASAGNSGLDGGIAAVAVDASVMAATSIDAAAVAAVTIDAAPPEPRERDVTISFDARPLDTIEISVDGKRIAGEQYQIKLLEGATRKVTIVARAPGHKTQKLDYIIEQDDKVTIHLDKRSESSRGSKGERGSKRGRGGSGTLIDI